jgi:hypothetical protein
MLFGSMPNDGGHLLLGQYERDELLSKEPQAGKWIRRVLGATEFLHSKERWCLWLVDSTEKDICSMPQVKLKTMAVRALRAKSTRPGTRAKASTPHLFAEIRHPKVGTYILVPKVSSERRNYIPIGFFDSKIISTDLNFIIPGGTLYEFGVLTSQAHNDWMRLVAGRLKSDYRYSNTLVYNTFPWPEIIDAQRKEIERLAEEVLLTRAEFPGFTLAELYDPDKMPTELLSAHQVLDTVVDKLYRKRPFKDSADRLSCLLERYEELIK